MNYKLLVNINDENILKMYANYQNVQLNDNIILIFQGDELNTDEKKAITSFFQRKKTEGILIIDITTAIQSLKNNEMNVFRVKLDNAYLQSLRENNNLKKEDFTKKNPGYTKW